MADRDKHKEIAKKNEQKQQMPSAPKQSDFREPIQRYPSQDKKKKV